MYVTRERIGHILELTDMRDMLLPFRTCLNLVNAGVVFTILESISGLKAWSEQILEAYDCLKLLFIYFDLLVDAAGTICLLGTDLHAVNCRGFRGSHLILLVLLPFLLSHRCHQQRGDW